MAFKIKGAELLLISLVLCSLANAKQLVRLSSGLECPEPGYFRDAVDCRRFYYCPFPQNEGFPLKDAEEELAFKEIVTKGLECPEGTLFDDIIGACQNDDLMSTISPECLLPRLSKPRPERQDGLVQDMSNNKFL